MFYFYPNDPYLPVCGSASTREPPNAGLDAAAGGAAPPKLKPPPVEAALEAAGAAPNRTRTSTSAATARCWPRKAVCEAALRRRDHRGVCSS